MGGVEQAGKEVETVFPAVAVDAAVAGTHFLGSESEEAGFWEGVREWVGGGREVLGDVGA